MMKPLDLKSFPLAGINLIEASAGTGKTYTVSNLYLRYLLEKQYLVEQILVVTFTEAATQELKERIRGSIVSTLEVFEEARRLYPQATQGADLSVEQINRVSDEILPSHLLNISESLEQDLLRLRAAERQIDLAEIHTIHGFCQKVIRENALLLQLSPQQTLQENPDIFRRQLVEDLWRTHVLKLPAAAFRLVSETWKEPMDLSVAIKPLLSRHPVHVFPKASGDTEEGATEEGATELQSWIDEFERANHWFNDLADTILEHADAATKAIEQSDIARPKDKLNWITKAKDWASNDRSARTFTGLKLERLRASELRNGHKKNAKLWAEHALFEFLDHHLDHAPNDPKPGFIPVFFKLFQNEYQLRKRSLGILDFDDLIMRMYEVLGPSGNPQVQTRLVEQLRKRYAVALIDEFQDTDRHQYAIFNRGFGTQCAPHDASLVLIGDPKQAIYGFRGGDMATYLEAKRQVREHHDGQQFGMMHNWRSSPTMVEAVNRLFASRDQAFLHPDIPFMRVEAAKPEPAEDWGPALRITQALLKQEDSDGKAIKGAKVNKNDIVDALAMQCVVDVSELLQQREDLKLSSSDIAILVRDRKEAAVIRNMLASKGIKACFDDRDSIFHTQEARVLQRLLAAVADPGNDYLMRQCLAEPLFQVTDDFIERMTHDSSAYLRVLGLLQGLHELWLQSGVRAMVQVALKEFGTLKEWSQLDPAGSMWERSASNILQLLELLQEQSRSARTPRALLDWLHRQMVSENVEQKSAYELRLESDDELLRIVTVHKSKGLEYKVVFVPFLFSAKSPGEVWFYDSNDDLCISFEPSDEDAARAEHERLAEDMRLLYVALTRSRYRCYVGTAAYKGHGSAALGFQQTALGHLLRDEQSELNSDTGLSERLLSLSSDQQTGSLRSSPISLNTVASEEVELGYDSAGIQEVSGEGSELDDARVLTRAIEHGWKVQSFTGLLHEHHVLSENAEHGSTGIAPVNPSIINILNFPRGSQAGTFLHTLFESISLNDKKLLDQIAEHYESLDAYIADQLTQQALVPQHLIKAWAEYLASWLASVLKVEVVNGISLSDLKTDDYLVEANFHFSVSDLKAERLNQILRSYVSDTVNQGGTGGAVGIGDVEDLEDLLFSDFKGHIKGAIDLMFRRDGRYYILDYKSNHLGYAAEDYSSRAMTSAIRDHRYDLQYLLYTIALHRLLKHRMGSEYDYDKHIGGVVYLFLRGLYFEDGYLGSAVEGGMPGVYFDRPSKELIEELDHALGGAQG